VDDLPDTIAAFGTLLTGRKCKASKFGMDDAAAILKNVSIDRMAPVLDTIVRSGRRSLGRRSASACA